MRETGRNGVAAYLTNRVKQTGGVAYKIKFEQRRGAPDYLVAFPAPHHFFGLVETKAPSGALDNHQLRMQYVLSLSGCPVFTVWSKDDIDNFIFNVTQKKRRK